MPPAPSISAHAEAAEALASMQSHQSTRRRRGEMMIVQQPRNDSTTSPPQVSHVTTSAATGDENENEHLHPQQVDEKATNLRESQGGSATRMPPPRTVAVDRTTRQDGTSPEGGGGGDILSRMVTASGVRVASMQDFQRSLQGSASPDGSGREAGDSTTAVNNASVGGVSNKAGSRSSSSDNSGRTLSQCSLNLRGGTTSSSGGPSGGPGLSNHSNPLLRMMEERMAAKQQQSQSQAQTTQSHQGTPPSPALQASINKWASIDKTISDGNCNNRGSVVVERPGSGGKGAIGSKRDPLSSKQEKLLMELINSQVPSSSSVGVARQGSMAQHRAAGLAYQPGQASNQPTSSLSGAQPQQCPMMAQHEGAATQAYHPSQASQPLSSSTMAPQPLGGLMPPIGGGMISAAQDPLASARLGLNRCAMSAATLSAGHAAQRQHFIRQVRAAQQRQLQQQQFQQQFALRRNSSRSAIAASLSQSSLITPPEHRIDRFGRPNLTYFANAQQADPSCSSAMRKRRSGSTHNDDNFSEENSRSSLATHGTNTSASSGSNKMRRTTSYRSGCLYGSMNSLRLQGSNTTYDLGGAAQRGNDMLLRRNASSSQFVRSVISKQSSAGLAAAAFEAVHRQNSTFVLPVGSKSNTSDIAGSAMSSSPSGQAKMTVEQVAQLRGLQQQRHAGQVELHRMIQLQAQQQQHEQQKQADRVACPANGSAVQASSTDGSDSDGQSPESGGESRDVLYALPVQVNAEDYSAPPTTRSVVPSSGASVSSASSVNSCVDKIIVSDVPDRIKYKDAPVEVKPMDVVVSALRARGASPEVIPSGDMEPGYFVEITEMYIQEAVDAIRGNDVACLRRLHEDGRVLDCGNGFGETLMHMACRRSDLDVVSMLLTEVRASLRVKDGELKFSFKDITISQHFKELSLTTFVTTRNRCLR